ncbi:MAG: hypothetical protein IPP13_22470 [Kouleothrix sp.]|nr:hypothetical protein [Kouleothrix sp.]
MKAHLSYLLYVLRHKWHVAYAGVLLGVPPWQLLMHDWTKFTPIEWSPYVHQFYNPDGSKRIVRDASGGYGPNTQSQDFQRAWLHHQRQPHHWQAWCSIGDEGRVLALSMPQHYVAEMVADWYGAGMAISGKNDVEGWYLANKGRIVLEADTRRRVEEAIQNLMLKISRTPVD